MVLRIVIPQVSGRMLCGKLHCLHLYLPFYSLFQSLYKPIIVCFYRYGECLMLFHIFKPTPKLSKLIAYKTNSNMAAGGYTGFWFFFSFEQIDHSHLFWCWIPIVLPNKKFGAIHKGHPQKIGRFWPPPPPCPYLCALTLQPASPSPCGRPHMCAIKKSK